MSNGQYLRGEQWTPVPAHAVTLAFLRAEWDKMEPVTRFIHRSLVHAGELSDPAQNALRHLVLMMFRGAMLRDIPPDTRWFKVQSLRDSHLHELRAINHPEWTAPSDRNELLLVAARKQLTLRSDADVGAWEPILWGHTEHGPFTILEGNNRLTAYAGTPSRPPLQCTAYVGLSPSKCQWHSAV